MPIERPTLWMKVKRFFRMTFKGHVLLKRIQEDPETGGYKIIIEETTREELPIEAVHISGKSNQFAIDEIGLKHPYNVAEGGFTAIDLSLWLDSNVMNEVLSLKWDGLQGLDAKKVGFGAAILIGIVIIVWVFMGGMA